MRASKIGLLILILLFGGIVETAWFVENHFDAGPAGCRVMRGRFYGPSFSFDVQERRPVPAGIALEVDNAFGAVRVKKGAPGEVVISLHKVVFRRTEAEARVFADKVRVSAAEEGGTLRVTSNRADMERGSETERVGFETHFDLTVPPDTPVKVRNEHGEVEITDAARAEVWSSFEDVRVERVAGAVNVDTRHGDAEVVDVGGDVVVSNRHGGVAVREVKGQLQVDSEHGDVAVSNVGPSVLRATHGDVTAQTVRGALEVIAQHSEVSATEVAGSAKVETSYEPARLHKITGDIRVTVEHGGVEVEDAQGSALIKASYNGVKLQRVVGPVEVEVEHGGVEATGIEKGARVKAVGDGVVLARFAGPVEVEVERADAHLTPAGPLVAPVTVRTVHGGITMEVPAGSRMALEATVRQGEIEVDVPGLTVQRTGDDHQGQRITGRLGDAPNPVHLQTEHGNLRITATTSEARQR